MKEKDERRFEIFYSDCCGLCVHFKACNGGCANSVLGNCEYKELKVWSHNWCDNFEMDKELAEEFSLM